jgi:hypothetical protein
LKKLIAKQYQIFEHQVLHPWVSAFRVKYSCNSVLMAMTEKWSAALDQKQIIGTMLIDLSKAFDSFRGGLTYRSDRTVPEGPAVQGALAR